VRDTFCGGLGIKGPTFGVVVCVGVFGMDVLKEGASATVGLAVSFVAFVFDKEVTLFPAVEDTGDIETPMLCFSVRRTRAITT